MDIAPTHVAGVVRFYHVLNVRTEAMWKGGAAASV